MKIQDLINKDTIITTLNDISAAMDKDWEHFGPLVIIYNDNEGVTHDRFFGSNAEIIGMLDIGRTAHLHHIFMSGDQGEIEEDK